MTNHFKPDHEEILIFLEDNISKLVRLKVASKAKYEAYDDSSESLVMETSFYFSSIAACAAANLAIGTRKGEQLT